MADTLNYKMQVINPTDYELNLTYRTKNKVMSFLLLKSKKVIRRKTGKEVEGELDSIDNFLIPPQYWNYLKTVISGHLRGLEKEFRADGIDILDSRIKQAYFTRDPSRDWIINIKICGLYADKR